MKNATVICEDIRALLVSSALRRSERYISWILIRKIVLLGHHFLNRSYSYHHFLAIELAKRVATLIVAFSINSGNDPVTIAIVT